MASAKRRVQDQEAVRITVIHCLDMLRPLKEKIGNALPKEVDPHGIKKSWLTTAEENLRLLLEAIVENEF
jgi:hypothetical protein